MSEYDELVESLRSYSTEMLSYKIDGAFAYAVTAAADAIEQLSTKCRQLEKERDAAVADLKSTRSCQFCRHMYTVSMEDEPCNNCECYGRAWEWRGVQEEENGTEV